MGPKAAGAVDALTEMLTDARRFTYRNHNYRSLNRSFQVNISAIRALRSIGRPAGPALVTALSNDNSMVRQIAAGALSAIDQPIAPQHWIGALTDSNQYVRIYAARQLGKDKIAPAVATLCGALKDTEMQVRVEAAKALGRIGDKAAIDPLIAALSDDKFNAGVAASHALAQIGRPAVEAVIKRFEKLDDRAKHIAPEAIRHADPNEIKELLHQCLKSSHWQLRAAATHVLAARRTPEALDVAKNMTDDPHSSVRWAAAYRLGKMADSKTADTIRPILLNILANDKAAKVRKRALWSLYYFPGKPPADFRRAIEAAMADKSPIVREAAVSSAHKFWDPSLAPAVMRLLKDAEPTVRSEAALVLGARNVTDAIPDLVRMLADTDIGCIKRASFALGRFGTDKAVDALIDEFEKLDEIPERRIALLQGLCQTKNPKAIAPLTSALKDQALRSQRHGIQAALKRLSGD